MKAQVSEDCLDHSLTACPPSKHQILRITYPSVRPAAFPHIEKDEPRPDTACSKVGQFHPVGTDSQAWPCQCRAPPIFGKRPKLLRVLGFVVLLPARYARP